MKKILLVCLLFSFMLPCFAGNLKMNKTLESWLGYPLDSLIAQWGVPTEEKNIADKRMFYWKQSRQAYVPQTSNTSGTANAYANVYRNSIYGNGNYNSMTTTYGGYAVTYYCNRIIGVDENKIINHWQWEGNRCPISYKSLKKWVNPQNDIFAQEKANKIANKEAKKELKKQQREEIDNN